VTDEANAKAAIKDDEADGVHRLRDIVVEEVSLVDRAANKRRFLVVKRSEDMADDSASTELLPDGRGGLTVRGGGVEKAKKKPAAAESDVTDEEKRKKPGAGDEEPDEAEKAKKPADDDEEEDDAEKAEMPAEDDESDDAEKKPRKKQALTIPTPVKEAILRSLTEALERLMSVANRVKEASETDERLDAPVPDEVGAEVAAIAELLGGIGESYPSPKSKAAVAKAGARMAKDRLDRFQKAMALLAEILKELTDSKEAPARPSAGAAEASVKKRDAAAPPAIPGLAELVAGIGELTRVVKRQEEEFARIRQARGVSNAIPVDAGGRRAEPQEVSWPLDMNRPISRDKVRKEVSFFDE
jgi:hypothetical protein